MPCFPKRRAMTTMLFGEVPTFDNIMTALHRLEDEINRHS